MTVPTAQVDFFENECDGSAGSSVLQDRGTKNTADTLFQMRMGNNSGTKKEADSEGICGQ